MKKILGIVLAMAMVASVFAAEPVANLSVTEFTGNASVTWGVDLDASKTGFENAATASLKLNIIDGGSKATASDADVWGEIAIKTDGDTFEKAENGALPASPAVTVKVDYAKLHVGPAYIGITSGNTKVGGIKVVSATANESIAADEVAAVEDHSQGITLGLDLDGVANFTVDFRSAKAGESKYSNNYGLAAEVDVKAVENLTLVGGVSVDFDNISKIAAGVKAAYEMALTDVFYIKPQVGYTYNDGANAVAGGLLFGWNKAEAQDTNIYFINKKVANGASAEVLYENDKVKLNAGIWDSATLIDNLTFGAEFTAADVKAADKGTVIAEAKYVAAVGDGKVTPKAGVKVDLGTKVTAVKAGVECAGFVPFTTFSVDYATADIKNVKGTIDLTCQIAF